jgi:hypothetical protein
MLYRSPQSRTNRKASQLIGIVRGAARRRHFSLAIISVTVQLWTQVFWVISVYFNIRNTLPKSGTFLLGHPVYIYIYIPHYFKYKMPSNLKHIEFLNVVFRGKKIERCTLLEFMMDLYFSTGKNV